MDNVLIAYLALIVGICFGTAICVIFIKINTILPKKGNLKNTYKYKEETASGNTVKSKTDNNGEGTVSLSDKIPDKSFTFTDINCAADKIDPDEFIKKMRSHEDSAYTSLKNKIDKVNEKATEQATRK